MRVQSLSVPLYAPNALGAAISPDLVVLSLSATVQRPRTVVVRHFQPAFRLKCFRGAETQGIGMLDPDTAEIPRQLKPSG